MRTCIRQALTALALLVLPAFARSDDALTSADKSSFGSYFAPSAPAPGGWTSSAQNNPQATPARAVAEFNSIPWCDPCDDVGTWRDNTLFFFGGEAYKSLGDSAQPPGVASGFRDSSGVVGAFNTGFALAGDSPIRGQIGASYGLFDLKGRDTISPSSSEQQTFITAGVYKRSEILAGDPLSWGLVYDQFWAHQWGLLAGELYVGQVRGIAGYALNERHEVGVWGAFRTSGDASTSVAGPPLRAMNQYNVYWRRNWDFGGQTMLYVGGHDAADVGSWLLGVTGQAPLSDHTALYGNFTYAFPGSATGIVGSNDLEWNFGLGLIYSWGGKVASPTVSGRSGLPLLPVANNGSLLISN